MSVARFSYHVTLAFFLTLLVVAAVGILFKNDKVVTWAQELSIVCLILSGVFRALALSVYYSVRRDYLYAMCSIIVVTIFVVTNVIQD